MMLWRSYSRLAHAHWAQQHQMGLMKYSSHYVTHSDSLPSETNGECAYCQWGRLPENRLLAEWFKFIPSDPQYQYLNQISVIELVVCSQSLICGERGKGFIGRHTALHLYSKAPLCADIEINCPTECNVGKLESLSVSPKVPTHIFTGSLLI